MNIKQNKRICVTLAQIPVYTDISKNVTVLKDAILKAADDKADILLTPEGSLSGYHHVFDQVEAKDALQEVTAFAKERTVGLALGTCFFEEDGICYDQLRFYLPNGEYLGCHTKTLLCGSLDDEPIGEIRHYGIMPLKVFDYMGITIGGLVCNDMWANPSCTPGEDPNMARLLARKGAKIIFHTVNGGRDASTFSQETVKQYHESHILLKARAHNVFIATVDNAYPLDLGVSAIGGVASPEGWQMRMKDIGCQIESYIIDISDLGR